MTVAVTQGQCGTGATVTWANAEGNIVFSREDSIIGTTPTPVPSATGTNFSWIKNLVLAVTSTGTTNITNRRISMSVTPPTGIQLFWKAVAVASYAQAASGNKPTDSGSNGATPAGYTLMTTSLALYDNTSVATSATGPNGSMVVVVCGIDRTYVGGAGNAIVLPNPIISYDEA